MPSLPVVAEAPADSPVLRTEALGFPWPTVDPFLFCVYHDDAYPAANAQMGPAAPLAGRDIGQDFSRKDGWSMYHGSTVPGFPAHPHRGFETVTIVRKGLIDHADSLGATARFGRGDVQWLTAGRGVAHSEMFPLLDRDGPNPLELFQIRLNDPDASVDARWTLPAAADASTRRQLYCFKGDSVSVAGQAVCQASAIALRADAAVELVNGPEASELLLLQGRPIGEPVAQHGPFVMNTEAEIRQAFADHQRTRYGGWPWPDGAPVHGRAPDRFARHPGGAEEWPEAGASDPAPALPSPA